MVLHLYELDPQSAGLITSPSLARNNKAFVRGVFPRN
jgi:hypothetical protein